MGTTCEPTRIKQHTKTHGYLYACLSWLAFPNIKHTSSTANFPFFWKVQERFLLHGNAGSTLAGIWRHPVEEIPCMWQWLYTAVGLWTSQPVKFNRLRPGNLCGPLETLVIDIHGQLFIYRVDKSWSHHSDSLLLRHVFTNCPVAWFNDENQIKTTFPNMWDVWLIKLINSYFFTGVG